MMPIRHPPLSLVSIVPLNGAIYIADVFDEVPGPTT